CLRQVLGAVSRAMTGQGAPAAAVEVVRVYDAPGRRPGEHRVLVDRLWPRGVQKAALDLDEWAKDAAPSAELRRWYGHDPARFAEFASRYRAELELEPGLSALERLRAFTRSGHGRLVLLTATRDVEHSGAAVLRDVVVAGGGR
ncbi:MAG: DUF488 domain-containing protein, partial [Acidimicrobiales bacterium]